MIHSKKKKPLLPIFLLITYSAILIKVMVFKDVPMIKVGSVMLNFGGTDASRPANFEPFKTILPYLLGDKGLIIAGINLVGNIILLVPIGFLIPFIFRSMTWKKSLILAVGAGLVIEVLQVILSVGIFDIDDVILNGLGVMVGYWIFTIFAKLMLLKKYKTILFTIIIGIIVAAAAYYAFTVHLKSQPVKPRVSADQKVETVNSEIPETEDLCGGTGGTGQIISKGTNTITIKRKDDVRQVITITNKTDIQTSAGSASQSDLKIGDHVTLVIYDSKTASAILVCSAETK